VITLALVPLGGASARQSSHASHAAASAATSHVAKRKPVRRSRPCRAPCAIYGEPDTTPYGAGFGMNGAPDSLPPVNCEVHREQITDLYGWRVRDVMHCAGR
jgi:hypothetical protein